MSWYDDDKLYRVPLTVDNNSGAGTIDVTITIPADFGLFWSQVATTGHDIQITDSDGFTALTWGRQTWDHAARSAVLQINDWAPDSADATVIAWLYFGDASPSDTATSFTVTSAKTGTLLSGKPPPGAVIIPAQSLAIDNDVPQGQYSWPPGQSGYVIFDVTDHLAKQAGAFQGKGDFEEVAAVTVETRNGGVAYGGGNTPAKTRMSQYDGRALVWMFLTGSVDGQDYIDEITVTTTLGRVFVFAARRVAETAEES
jgi:hypothetical protein